MSKDRPTFNWSDAWLLLAVALANQRGPATLEAIIAAGDRINFAIFKADELESGLVRLSEAGFIVENSGSLSLTNKLESHLESFLAEERSMGERLSDVQEILGAAPAPDEQPCNNNLKYPGFSRKLYEDAVERYQGYVR